jgi:MFS family permease
MVICDLVRMTLVGIVAIPGMSVWAMFALMFATAMLSPPFDAARSALLSQTLTGDRYVLGVSLQTSMLQSAQILGYITGGALMHINSYIALGIDAVTFGLSALFITLSVRPRRPAIKVDARKPILRETAEGIEIVFGQPILRAIAIVVFAGLTFIAVPEGLAAGWAADLHLDGEAQGLIMAAAPAGMALGGLVLPRLVPPAMRRRILRPLVILAPLALAPALFRPPLPVVISMILLAGFAFGGFSPIANGLFVQALPNSHRARAFGVMSASMQLIQGIGLLAAGALTAVSRVPVVIGAWCAGGTLLMLAASAVWPASEVIDAAIAETKATNEAAAKLAG